MAIFTTTEVPRRKPQPKDPWSRDPDYRALQELILAGTLKPGERRGMHIHEAEMGERLGLLNPVRSAIDNMRRFIKSKGLEDSWWAQKYQTDKPGVWALIVTYDPPKRPRKATAEGALGQSP